MGGKMVNNRQYKRKMHRKVDNISSSFSLEFSKIIKILVVIAIFFVVFYLLTVYILQKDDTSTIINTIPGEAEIQYQEILAGNSFSVDKGHYYVLYYDMSDENLKSSYTSLITAYEEKENHMSIYTVDISSAFNKKYISDISNVNVANIDDLKIPGPTLIEIQSGKAINYVEGQEKIEDILR